MAKSKSGGSRAYLRGRIGSDVYSIGKNGKGEKQQVVRSLAEQVANPQTLAQMKGRMYMSTVMQMVSQLSQFIDHSFDNVPNGQPCISEFIRINYALVKADAEAHPSSSNKFGLNKYHEKGAKRGAYQVAKGEAAGLSAEWDIHNGSCQLDMTTTNKTIADYLETSGLTINDYWTFLGWSENNEFVYARVKVKEDADMTKTLTSENLTAALDIESNKTCTITVETSHITFSFGLDLEASGAIVSRKTANGFIHNNAVIQNSTGAEYNSDAALPTYPVGKAKFLNGGDL